MTHTLDAVDRALIAATQDGLPLVPEPWKAVGETVGLDEATVIARFQAMLARGAIRRIGAVPNHWRLGLAFNGMTVWDVDDREIDRLGALVGALPFVTHCYRRPRTLPAWPYNLFAMVHGRTNTEVVDKRAEIAALLGDAVRGADILYSRRILKKTGLRIAGPGATSVKAESGSDRHHRDDRPGRGGCSD
jgi:DNA-binding Lrp family transcriptional regulator